MSVKMAEDIKEYISLAQQLQEAANKYQIYHIFEDGGYKEFIMLKMFELNREEGRHGDDGVDSEGKKLELKTVNLINTKGKKRKSPSITTCHHLNYDIISRYRQCHSWLIGVFYVNEPARIYELKSVQLEPYFKKWEVQLDELSSKGEKKPHLNNPKISFQYIMQHGILHYHDEKYDEYFQTKRRKKQI